MKQEKQLRGQRRLAPVAVEATTIVLVTVLGCVLGYEVIRKVPALRPLFGLPMRRR